jgi:glucosyl-3-phosphoglycerate phosphatase
MILIRHGQSEFNAVYTHTRVDPGIPDPVLTDLGRQQAQIAAERLAAMAVRRLIASPYTRALQTASIIGRHLGLPIEVNPLVRERAAFHCDIGTRKHELKQRFPALAFDHLDDPWWHDHVTLGVDETEDAVLQRCESFRQAIFNHPDRRHTAIVTHWGFIRAMTGKTVPNGEVVPVDELL